MGRLGFEARAAVLAAVLAAIVSGTAQANYLFLDGMWVKHDERVPTAEESEGLRLGLGFPLTTGPGGRLAIETALFGGPMNRVNNEADNQDGLTGDLVYSFDLGWVAPYVAVGLGAVREEINGLRNTSFAAQAGAGLLVNIDPRAYPYYGIRLGVQAQHVANNDISRDKDGFTDYRAMLGLVVPFAGSAPAPAPAPVAAPRDTDGDGVPDARDRCPSQPAATADGCPAAPVAPAEPERDTDGDGIPDSKDECPGTLGGLKVDASGCVKQAAQKIVLEGVTFPSGSTELTAEARAVLDRAAAALSGQAALKVEVGGHTDSIGNPQANVALSQRRAEAVLKYLVSKGVAASRLTARGYGAAEPIADNGTRDGRNKNRRVELKTLD
jgi:OmpA-OmpF porin, OOP family